jgi:endonuclease YncB( thermonuclease family)
MYEYRARVTRVIDGDTLVVEADLGFEMRFTMPIRLYGYNSWPINIARMEDQPTGAGRKSRSRTLCRCNPPSSWSNGS